MQTTFPSAVRRIEESLLLLKRAGLTAWLIYFLGVIPFFALLVFGITELAQNPFAADRLAGLTLSLTILYLWLHVAQSLFCNHLYAALIGTSDGIRASLAPAICVNAILAPTKLLVWPVALVTIVPFPMVTTFYQNSLLCPESSGNRGNWRRVISESSKATLYRQGEGTWIVMIILLLRLIFWTNLFVLLFVIPVLWKTFTGMEGTVTRTPEVLVNPTSMTALLALSYIGLDPLVKAVCMLRRFAQESERSGIDLRFRISELTRAAALFVPLVFFATGVWANAGTNPQIPAASPQPVSPDRFRTVIQSVFRDPSNTWNLPVIEHRQPSSNPFAAFLDSLLDHFEEARRELQSVVHSIEEFLRRMFSSNENEELTKPHPASPADAWLAVAIGTGLLVAAVAFAIWNRRNHPEPKPVNATITDAKIDITHPDVQPDRQSELEWSSLARQYRAGGNLRLALRALYLASLAGLAEVGLIALGRGKSNRDYLGEIQRRARRLPHDFLLTFGSNIKLFEQSWYGNYPVTEEILDSFERNSSVLRKSH